MSTQHADLSAERWTKFTLAQQILSIGAEMNRADKLFGEADRTQLRLCYERVLRLTDLTVETNPSRSLRRELLRWRELAASQYVAEAPDRALHRALFRSLLLLNSESSRQIPYLEAASQPNWAQSAS